MVQNLVQDRWQQLAQPQAHILWVQDMSTILDASTQQAIHEAMRYDPVTMSALPLSKLPLIAFTELPRGPQRDEHIYEGYQRLLDLHRHKIIQTTILLDKSSEYACVPGPDGHLHGEEGQNQAGATALVNLEMARAYYYERNPTFTQVVQHLGQQAAFLGMAFVSSDCPALPQLNDRLLRSMPPTQYENVITAVIMQLRAATYDVLKPKAQAIEADIVPTEPLCLVYSVPGSVYSEPAHPHEHDTAAFWRTVADQMTSWLVNEHMYPNAQVVFLPAPPNEGCVIHVAAIFPLPTEPKPIQRLRASLGIGATANQPPTGAGTGATANQPPVEVGIGATSSSGTGGNATAPNIP